ncbi:MAG TPA: trypsin-like peptidase domain-containing protein [bacterium]|nr:trypsin-like peptidase domain-containing protein [bacterium]
MTRLGRGIAALSLVWMLAVACIGTTAAWSASKPSANEIYEMAKLASVMVLNTINVQVAVPHGQISSAKSQLLVQQVRQMMQAGQIAQTQEAAKAAVVRLLLNDPLAYVEPSDRFVRKRVQMQVMGSGFFVTPDGYIVTNAHVVTPSSDDLKQAVTQTATQFVAQFLAEDTQSLTQLLGYQLSTQTMKDLQNADTQYVLKYMRIENVGTAVAVEMGAAVPGVVVGQRGAAAEVAAKGAVTPGKDVAILKIEGRQYLPTLPMGDETQLNVSDPLLVIGYPGDATFLPILSSASQVEPTLTAGILSRRAEMSGGWTALQTDATVHHGNSGGPVLNTQGQVVGIATFGASDAAGTNFIVPTTIIKEFLKRAGADPRSSKTSELYAQALGDYGQSHYRAAFAIFQQVDALFPGNPFVKQFMSSSQAAILAGKDRPATSVVATLAKWIGVLVLVAAVMGLALRRGQTLPGARILSVRGVHPRAAAAPAAQSGIVPPTATALCSQCGAVLTPGQKFCGSCGAAAAPARAVCSQCGAEAAPGQKFCGACGAPIA